VRNLPQVEAYLPCAQFCGQTAGCILFRKLGGCTLLGVKKGNLKKFWEVDLTFEMTFSIQFFFGPITSRLGYRKYTARVGSFQAPLVKSSYLNNRGAICLDSRSAGKQLESSTCVI
jgi:hypothetical protein